MFSPEDDAENLFALIEQLGSAAVVPVYQHTPLMISATRPAAKREKLTDRHGRTFRMEQNGREFVLFDEKPFSLMDHLDELKSKGANRFRIDLSYGDNSSALIARMLAGGTVTGDSGNFYRGLR